MVPRPTATPMPDPKQTLEARARLLSLYFRPWTLLPNCIVDGVRRLHALRTGDLRRRAGAKALGTYAASWRWYVRGHVVSTNAAQLIRNVLLMTMVAPRCNTNDIGTEEDHGKTPLVVQACRTLTLQKLHDVVGTREVDADIKADAEQQKADGHKLSKTVLDAVTVGDTLWKTTRLSEDVRVDRAGHRSNFPSVNSVPQTVISAKQRRQWRQRRQ